MYTGPLTINMLFREAAARFRNQVFLRYKSGGLWKTYNYADVNTRVRHLALGLSALGLRNGDRIAIWSENRPEWNFADLATLAIGAVDVPIYTTQSPKQIEYILSDSRARAIFVSSPFLAAAVDLKTKLHGLEFVITFDSPDDAAQPGPGTVTEVEALSASGLAMDRRDPEAFDRFSELAGPDDLASQIYTSGTTGVPKGVMLSHKNLAANTLNTLRWMKLEHRRDVALSYLPLSHIFERAAWYLYMTAGTEIAYAESLDRVPQNLLEIKPTVMTSVPRMFEKMYSRLLERGTSLPFPRRQMFFWSLEVGRQWAAWRDRRGRPGRVLALKHRIADAIVFRKIRQLVGGRMRTFISGGAALAPDIAYVFLGAGLTILQGYGLTETSPTVSANTEEHNRVGTVGRVLEGVDLKIAGDGEILVKGATVTSGYYNRPEANSEAFGVDGWFHTGDIGYLDSDGYLVITDRKKDLIKTSGGKYIAPQHIENMIKGSRFVSQAVIVGNGRKFAAALIHPNLEMLESYAAHKGIDHETTSDLLSNPRVKDLIRRQVAKYTGDLAGYEKIKAIALLPKELTIEADELTPTLKPRRRVIEERYAELIDTLYQEKGTSAAAD